MGSIAGPGGGGGPRSTRADTHGAPEQTAAIKTPAYRGGQRGLSSRRARSLAVGALQAADRRAPGRLVPGGRPAPVVPGRIRTRGGRHILRPRVEVAIGLHLVLLSGSEGHHRHRVEHPLLVGGQLLAEATELLRKGLALLNTRE